MEKKARLTPIPIAGRRMCIRASTSGIPSCAGSSAGALASAEPLEPLASSRRRGVFSLALGAGSRVWVGAAVIVSASRDVLGPGYLL